MVSRESWPAPSATRILAVANQKGGVGKTTTTVNVAVALAEAGLNVLAIDLDPQGNASTAFGIDHSAGVPGTYEALVAGRPLVEVAVDVPEVPGLRAVPATVDLAGAEIELVSVVARESRLKRAVQAYPDPLDYVLIDCPPSLGLLTLNGLVAAREVLLPIQTEYYALEGLSQLLRNVELVQAHLNQDLTVSTVLLTMYDSRTKLADQVVNEVRSFFGDAVLDAVVPRSVRVSEAPGYGQSVLAYDRSNRGAVAYLNAAREIAVRGGEPGAEITTRPAPKAKPKQAQPEPAQPEPAEDAAPTEDAAPVEGAAATEEPEAAAITLPADEPAALDEPEAPRTAQPAGTPGPRFHGNVDI